MRSTVRRVLPLLVVALVVAASPVAAKKRPDFDAKEFRFAVNDLDGEPVRSSDPRFAGKVLVVTLWGTWCPPCITEIPTWIDLQERLGPRGLEVVAIAVEDASEPGPARRERLREFVAENDINYLVLDGQSSPDDRWPFPGLKEPLNLPIEVLIDRDGALVDIRYGYGYSKRWARRLERELTELLADVDGNPQH